MDNVIEIVVHGWKAGTKYTCKSCGIGKFTADTPNQACPKCGQKHQVKVQM